MGLFGKKKIDPPAPRTEVIVADGAVLAEARRLLLDFHRSQMAGGTDGQARAAVAAIARTGSLPDAPAWARSNQEFMVRMSQDISQRGGTGVGRPWRWLTAVAKSAERRDDAELVAHVALFVVFWLCVMSPHLTVNDEMDMRLPKGVPTDARREVLTTAQRALPGLGLDHVIVDDRANPENVVTVGMILAMCETAERAPA